MLNSRVRKDGDCGRGYWDVRFAEGQCAAMELQESSVGSASVSDIGFIGQGLAFRFLVAVDAEGFSRCCAAEQAGIQDDLDRALGQAAEATGMDRNQWGSQSRGDGELAELPVDVDSLSLVGDFPGQLAAAISEINATRVAGPRLRVRMAIHHGAVSPGRFGSVGPATVLVTRLLDAGVVRQQLRNQPGRDLALIVSATVFEEVITTRFHGLCPEEFARVAVHTKGVAYAGFLYQGGFVGVAAQIPAIAAGI